MVTIYSSDHSKTETKGASTPQTMNISTLVDNHFVESKKSIALSLEKELCSIKKIKW